jgi:hypothetical protein
MFKTIGSKETSQIAMVTGSQPNILDIVNIRREASRHFRNKKRDYLKDIINELVTHNKNKNIRDLYRGVSECQKGYQSICKKR